MVAGDLLQTPWQFWLISQSSRSLIEYRMDWTGQMAIRTSDWIQVLQNREGEDIDLSRKQTEMTQ